MRDRAVWKAPLLEAVEKIGELAVFEPYALTRRYKCLSTDCARAFDFSVLCA